MKVWLDVAVFRCPNCARYYVDASWYVVKLRSDIECGECGIEFNSRKNATDRVMLEFYIDENGKMKKSRIVEHLELE